MLKEALISISLFSSMFCSQDSKISISFKKDQNKTSSKLHTYINDQEVFCSCGKQPVITLFLYGTPEHYCSNHIPEIEIVRPIAPDYLTEVLKSIGSDLNMNGHNGQV